MLIDDTMDDVSCANLPHPIVGRQIPFQVRSAQRNHHSNQRALHPPTEVRLSPGALIVRKLVVGIVNSDPMGQRLTPMP
jgi:hypothetical protein